MSKVLIRVAIIMLRLATMGSANARTLNHSQPHPGYAGWASSSPSSVGPWEFVPGRGIMGESCDSLPARVQTTSASTTESQKSGPAFTPARVDHAPHRLAYAFLPIMLFGMWLVRVAANRKLVVAFAA